MKKTIYTILIITWMSLIFMFSNQPATESSKLSDGFISTTIGNIYKLFNNDVSEEKLIEIKKKYTTPVRKTAHFTIYLILGLLVTNLLKEYNIETNKLIIISITICLLYATSDEIHQLFIQGRSGEIRDVFIDTIGSTIGVLIVSKISKRQKKN